MIMMMISKGGSNCAKCTCGVSKPWPTWPPTPPVPSPAGGGAGLWATYGANFVQTSDSAELYYDSEPALFGLTHVSKYYNEYGLTMTERLAFVRCVESYLLDHASRANKTVKVNVAWDENDYQIDVGTDAGRTEYKRIIDRNAEFGVTHIVYVYLFYIDCMTQYSHILMVLLIIIIFVLRFFSF